MAGLRGFKDLGSDINWADYDGQWAKKDKATGDWYVLRFEYLEYREPEDDDCYLAEVLCIPDPKALDGATIDRALSCFSMVRTENGLLESSDGLVSPKKMVESTIVSALVAYGYYDIEATFKSSKQPQNLRAEAARYIKNRVK